LFRLCDERDFGIEKLAAKLEEQRRK